MVTPGGTVIVLKPVDTEENEFEQPTGEGQLCSTFRFWIETEKKSRKIFFVPDCANFTSGDSGSTVMEQNDSVERHSTIVLFVQQMYPASLSLSRLTTHLKSKTVCRASES